jgi:hypothetical protein
MGGWVGPRAGLDAVVKRKIPNPHHPACSPVAYTTELSWLFKVTLYIITKTRGSSLNPMTGYGLEKYFPQSLQGNT